MSSSEFDTHGFDHPTGHVSAVAVEAKPVRVFINAKFSGVLPSPQLLSIGFASDTGKELYVVIEGTDTSTCIDSHTQLVLDALHQGNPEALTRENAATRISAWLEELRSGESSDILDVLSSAKPALEQAVHLVADCTTTLLLFHRLFQAGNRLSNIDGLLADKVFSGHWWRKFLDLREHYHETEGNPLHAKDAAMSIRYAWDLVFDTWD